MCQRSLTSIGDAGKEKNVKQQTTKKKRQTKKKLIKLKGKRGKGKKQTESRNRREIVNEKVEKRKQKVDKNWGNLSEPRTAERG